MSWYGSSTEQQRLEAGISKAVPLSSRRVALSRSTLRNAYKWPVVKRWNRIVQNVVGAAVPSLIAAIFAYVECVAGLGPRLATRPFNGSNDCVASIRVERHKLTARSD
jgi:hypothetical protein